MTFNVYVPSYNRFDAIKTAKHLEYCTYVVRKSQEAAYRAAGVENIVAVEDSEIDSLQKVTNWIIEKTPEDVVALLDDDIVKVSYRLDELEKITDPATVSAEIERIAQLTVDLGIGYAAPPASAMLLYYDSPFKFVGTMSPMRVFNKAKLKARWSELLILSDMEFELTELLYNRIVLIPNYFHVQAEIDTNSGGNNTIKSNGLIDKENEVLKARFGKYWKCPGNGKAGKLMVKR